METEICPNAEVFLQAAGMDTCIGGVSYFNMDTHDVYACDSDKR